jgi:L-seryl-tRNA(Ser) seleniumtransferase
MATRKTARPEFIPPSIEEIVSDPAYTEWIEALSRPLVTELAREAVAQAKREGDGTQDSLTAALHEALQLWQRRGQHPVINATGVLIHTNLGRAPLDESFWQAVASRVTGYGALEFNLETGERGRRAPLVNRLVAELAGAEAGLVVNNCAAAVLLMLCVARGKNVIVSRGELVQIGGGFRIPEIMALSGARLVEVGTTNRTVERDYEVAIDSDTAAVLKVHRSNFEMTGFVEDVSPRALSKLCTRHKVKLLEDLGSGAVADLSKYGLPHERTLSDAVRDGADLVSASGDKLLGGTQAGLIAGKTDAVSQVAQHPLFRALRPGKITLAALEVAALAHLNGQAEERLPLYQLLATPVSKLAKRAESIARSAGIKAPEIQKSEAVTGGGTLPGARLDSMAIVVSPKSADQAAAALRQGTPPVIARVQDDKLYFDLKTVFPHQDELLARAIGQILAT